MRVYFFRVSNKRGGINVCASGTRSRLYDVRRRRDMVNVSVCVSGVVCIVCICVQVFFSEHGKKIYIINLPPDALCFFLSARKG